MKSDRISNVLFIFAMILVVYMPLHIFISQSASLITGGLDVWKAAKDVIVVLAVPFMLLVSYYRGLFKNRYFVWLVVLSGLYALLHLLFVVFDQNDDTYSAIVGSVYNNRLFAYLLLGILIGTAKQARKYVKYLLTAVVLIASAVAVFGVFQYFLPPDLLENVGYSLERGVKPLFFIDDKPDLPRVMSTIRDPNSLGAYLILPILMTGWAFFSGKVNEKLFVRAFRREVLGVMLAFQSLALIFTFSRGALVGLLLSLVTLMFIVTGDRVWGWVKKLWLPVVLIIAIVGFIGYIARDTYLVQNVIFHADESTVEADPNEKRILLYEESIDLIIEEPLGYGPGSAGIVAINNPQGGIIQENYYLQIAHEVGWLGLAVFVAIISIIAVNLYRLSRSGDVFASVVLASLVGYLFYSLLIHLWTNEALALQWWLLCGLALTINISFAQSVRKQD